MTTPMLIQRGENDRRGPIPGQQVLEGAHGTGQDVEMEIYPRGGHVIYEPQLGREITRRKLEWFFKWLTP